MITSLEEKLMARKRQCLSLESIVVMFDFSVFSDFYNEKSVFIWIVVFTLYPVNWLSSGECTGLEYGQPRWILSHLQWP